MSCFLQRYPFRNNVVAYQVSGWLAGFPVFGGGTFAGMQNRMEKQKMSGPFWGRFIQGTERFNRESGENPLQPPLL
jgi:hypothetical protein